MRRTLMERLVGAFRPDRALRRHPDIPAISLLGSGVLRLDLPNPVWADKGSKTAYAREGEEEHLARLCVAHDDRLLHAMMDIDRESPVRDLGLRYAATLSSGEILLRIPERNADVRDALANAIRARERGGLLRIAPGTPLPPDLDRLNAEDKARARADRDWRFALADAGRFRRFFEPDPDGVTIYPDARRALRDGGALLTPKWSALLDEEAEIGREALTRLQGERTLDGGVRFSRDRVLGNGLDIEDLITSGLEGVMTALAQMAEEAERERRWEDAVTEARDFPGFEAVPQAIIITVPLDKGEILRGLISLGGELLLNDRVRVGRADFLAADLSVEAIAEALNPAEEVPDAPEDLFGMPGA